MQGIVVFVESMLDEEAQPSLGPGGKIEKGCQVCSWEGEEGGGLQVLQMLWVETNGGRNHRPT